MCNINIKNELSEEEAYILKGLLKKLVVGLVFIGLTISNWFIGGIFLLLAIVVYKKRGETELKDFVLMLSIIFSLPIFIGFLGILGSIA